VSDDKRDQLIPSAPPQGGAPGSARIHTPVRRTTCIAPFKTLLAHSWRLGSLWGCIARRQRERHVGARVRLLRSLDPASGSVHCCEVPCRTPRSISTQVVTYSREVLLGFASLRELTERTRRRVGGCDYMGRLAVHCGCSHLLCCDKGALTQLGSSHH
jgi:hypothetical protein